jgi:cytochrome c5
MLKKRLAAACLLFVMMAVAVQVSAGKSVDPKAFFEATCSQCHSTNVPKAERLTRDGWKEIVGRMRSNGCVISDKEAEILVDYLTKEYGK